MDNIFMKVTDLEGSATTKGFEKQIGLYSFSHSLSQNCFSGGGTEGRTSGVCNHSDISVTKVMDKNSVKFNEWSCDAHIIKEIVITTCRQEGDSLIPIIVYTFADVLVSSYSVSAGGGGNPTESISFNYAKIKWEFTEQKTDGTKAGNVAAQWNLMTNEPKF